ncbi:MAG: hypothetical protein KGM47_01210, partial [Acidobacteriota bacterium]|nr:hypothetical protein [Acidobacteriota bacterium]
RTSGTGVCFACIATSFGHVHGDLLRNPLSCPALADLMPKSKVKFKSNPGSSANRKLPDRPIAEFPFVVASR